MTAHIYSTTASESRSVLQGSLGSNNSRYFDENYSLFYNGFVVVSTPWIIPEGFYLVLVPMDPNNQVNVWIHSHHWHGYPLGQVVQIDGSFTMESESSAAMPL